MQTSNIWLPISSKTFIQRLAIRIRKIGRASLILSILRRPDNGDMNQSYTLLHKFSRPKKLMKAS